MIRVDGMVATPSRTRSITPNMNKRIVQPYSRNLRKKNVVVLDRHESPEDMEEEVSVVKLRLDNTQYNSRRSMTTDTRKVNDKNSQWFCGHEQHMLKQLSHFFNARPSHYFSKGHR